MDSRLREDGFREGSRLISPLPERFRFAQSFDPPSRGGWRGVTTRRLLPHIFVDRHLRHRGGVDVAVRMGGDTFRRRVLRVFHRRRRNVAIDLAGLYAAETDAALAAGIVGVLARRILGFGIGDIEHVVLVDEDAGFHAPRNFPS